MFKHLFSQSQIGNIELANRFVVPAMVMNYCNSDGSPNERYFSYYEAKARGGWGLIITEDFAISPAAKGYTNIPGLWDDSQIEPHSELPKRIHRHGSKVVAQIYHAGRQTNHLITGERPVAPSPIPCPVKQEIPSELTIAEIEELIEDFGDCARRVKAAGFDGVEIHGAHGYLIAEFLSLYANKRSDRYGGSLLNRFRFVKEIISNIKAKAGNDFPIIFRISGDEFVPGGRNIEETKAVAMLLEEVGVDAIHVSVGVYASRHKIAPPARTARGWAVDFAAEVKKVISLPVITVGRITDPYMAEAILASEKADFVAMGRAALADPELPKKTAEGKYDEILFCVGCLQGCGDKIRRHGEPGGCMLNPLTGNEVEYKILPAKEKRKVLVIGGGVAGMEAAIVAAEKGHDVCLFEKEKELGGAYLLAAFPPGKGEICTFINWQKNQLEKFGVQLFLNTEVTDEMVLKEEPDVVIVATGSTPITPDIPGVDKAHVVNAYDVLSGDVEVGNRVIVVGGGLVGSETANHLAFLEKKVTIIEMTSEIAMDEEFNTRRLLMRDLKDREVKILVDATAQAILDDGVMVSIDGEDVQIGPADTVVIALGSNPVNGLYKNLKEQPFRIVSIGDSFEVRNALDAIEEGYSAGLEIE